MTEEFKLQDKARLIDMRNEREEHVENLICFPLEDVKEFIRLLKKESYKLTGGKETWFSKQFDKKIDKLAGEKLK